jgi:hypothetical protein
MRGRHHDARASAWCNGAIFMKFGRAAAIRWTVRLKSARPYGRKVEPTMPERTGKSTAHAWYRSSTARDERWVTVRVASVGVPNGIRTRVATLKGLCPRPLDDGDGGSAEANWWS